MIFNSSTPSIIPAPLLGMGTSKTFIFSLAKGIWIGLLSSGSLYVGFTNHSILGK